MGLGLHEQDPTIAAQPACKRWCFAAFAGFIVGAARCFVLAVGLLVPLLWCLCSLAAEPRPRSVLVLDQSDTTSPFYSSIFAGIRSALTADHGAPVSVHFESLDL